MGRRLRQLTTLMMVAVACTLESCGPGFPGITYSQTASVELPGYDTDESKVASAEAISRELWNGRLKHYIVQSVPGISEADLKGLGIRWRTFKSESFSGDPAKSISKVFIVCSYTSPSRNEHMAKIVAACKHLVEDAVKKHYEGKAAA